MGVGGGANVICIASNLAPPLECEEFNPNLMTSLVEWEGIHLRCVQVNHLQELPPPLYPPRSDKRLLFRIIQTNYL